MLEGAWLARLTFACETKGVFGLTPFGDLSVTARQVGPPLRLQLVHTRKREENSRGGSGKVSYSTRSFSEGLQNGHVHRNWLGALLRYSFAQPGVVWFKGKTARVPGSTCRQREKPANL